VVKGFPVFPAILPYKIASEVSEQEESWSNLREMLEKRGQPIGLRIVEFSKPLAVIYNPNSGKQKDIKSKIEAAVREINPELSLRFFETTHYMHAWELAEGTIASDDYSAIVAVGGDGTIHEVVNGLMAQPADRRLPLVMVPNGTGNDTLFNFAAKTLEESFAFLKRGTAIKIDLLLCTLDC
jgi:diacylglycerol kinase family enzyme